MAASRTYGSASFASSRPSPGTWDSLPVWPAAPEPGGLARDAPMTTSPGEVTVKKGAKSGPVEASGGRTLAEFVRPAVWRLTLREWS